MLIEITSKDTRLETVYLYGDNASIMSYVPKRSKTDATTESCDVLFVGFEWGREQINLLERLFEYARNQGQKSVYVYFRTHEADERYRSKILDGRVEYSKDVFDVGWASGFLEARIIWERNSYWEGEERELPLSNTTSRQVSGVMVRNHGTSTNPNHVVIAARDATTVLDAPIRIEVKNLMLNQNVRNVYVSYDESCELEHVLQTEAASAHVTSYVSNSQWASGGQYRSLTWQSSDETLLATWALSKSQMNAMNGRAMRFFLRFFVGDMIAPPIYGEFYLRLGLLFGADVIYQAPRQFVTGEGIQDLGVMPMPPYSIGENLFGISLGLFGELAYGGTIHIDDLQILPQVRAFKPSFGGLTFNEAIVDDGIEETLYKKMLGFGDARIGSYVGSGKRPALKPRRCQRLHFLFDNVTAGHPAAINDQIAVRAFYRPRRFL